MCLVIAAIRVVPGHPLVLLANRDEYYDRPAEAPRARGGDPEIVCGIDHRAGGTWLGVNAAGVVATLTNRPGAQDPARPSRGGVTMAALGARTARDGARRAADAASNGPNPFSLLVADREQAWFVAHDGGGVAPRVTEVPPGLHTHTNLHDLDGLPAAVVLAAEGFAPDA
ncbi:MAG: NRDE family protein, partial [Planctomycetes bacterium]|nr:NRDE family protein [Planctomycetota bacterium]